MLLTAITFLPLLFALIVCLLPKASWIRSTAFFLALFEFALSLAVLFRFNPSTAGLQFVTQMPWVPELGISYFLGIDGISLWLVLLTTFLIPLAILGSWNSINDRVKGFHAALFVLQTSVLGSFLAIDAVLFYVFFELSLIPTFFLVGIWGGKKRVAAGTKFFIYTMFGSLLMLLSIIYLMFSAREVTGEMTSNLLVLYQLKIPFVAGSLMNPQTLLFAAFALAFAIKVPIFPLHTWQADLYSEAPAAGSLVMASLLSKLGAYGLLRLVIPLFPDASEYFAWVFLFVGVIGIIYGGMIALIQPNMKRLVAYSSLSHMGYIVVGLFAMNTYGITGGVFQMISHGVTTGALFLLLGMLYERTRTLDSASFSGLAKQIPAFTILFFIATIASIAVPMTNGFVGEFLILVGAFEANKTFALFAVLGVVLSAAYMLWTFKKVFFGPTDESASKIRDISLREFAVIFPLVVLIFWMGLFPNHFLNWSKASIDHLVENKENYNLSIAQPVVPQDNLKAVATAE